jgi:uncharacterized membrane protein YdjX (TVP38/TMEM64 family)
MILYTSMNYPKLQRIIFVVFLVLIIGLFITFQILGYDVDSEKIRQYLKGFGILAPFIFIIIYTLGTFFIPATPFMIAAGILFGFKYGLLYTIISGFLSSTIVFSVSRKLGKEWVEKILEHRYLKHLNEYNKRLETGAVWDIMLLRVTPIMPFNALNALLGVSKITTRDYILGTLFGLVPTNVLTVYIGAFITKIF